MKGICTVLICCLAYTSWAQADFTPVNRDSVEKAVTNAQAPTYYPTLLERLNKFDTTLSKEEYRLLYYGYVFQSGYNAYANLNQTEIRQAMEKKDYVFASKLCDEVLQTCPISLYANYYKAVSLLQANREDSSFIKYRTRYSRLLEAIVSTGDGLTCKTAFKTIFVNDEYQVIYEYFEVKEFKGQALVYPCDKMSVTPSEYFKADAMYFDTSETFINMKKTFDPEKKKKRKG